MFNADSIAYVLQHRRHAERLALDRLIAQWGAWLLKYQERMECWRRWNERIHE